MTNIYKKLIIIQTSVDKLIKNKQGHNYNYVDGISVLTPIREIMNDQHLLLKQEVLSIENERYDYTTSKGTPKTEVLSKVMMKFTWIDAESGEKDENLFGANGMNDFDKGVGSALTYGERYFLLKYFHIPTDVDDVDAVKRDVATVYDKRNEDNRPWLNKGTKEYNAVVSRLQQKTTTIEQVQKYYKLSKDVKANLEACTQDLIKEAPLN